MSKEIKYWADVQKGKETDILEECLAGPDSFDIRLKVSDKWEAKKESEVLMCLDIKTYVIPSLGNHVNECLAEKAKSRWQGYGKVERVESQGNYDEHAPNAYDWFKHCPEGTEEKREEDDDNDDDDDDDDDGGDKKEEDDDDDDDGGHQSDEEEETTPIPESDATMED